MLFMLGAIDIMLFFWRHSFYVLYLAAKTLDNTAAEMVTWASGFVDEAKTREKSGRMRPE